MPASARRPHPRIALMTPFVALTFAALMTVPVAASGADEVRSLSANFLAGHVAQKRRDLPAAIKYLGRALEQDTGEPNLLRRTFLFSLMDGRIDDGLALATRYLEIEKKAPIATLALAVADAKKGDWAALKKRMAGLDSTGLNSFTAPALNAWATFAADGKEKGIEALKPLRDLGGTRMLYDLHVGLMHELSGELAAAETYYVSVAKDDGGATLRGARILGTLYERQGKIDEARAAYNLYLQAQPNSQFVDVDLARLDAGGKNTPVLVGSVEDGVAEALFGISSSLNRQGGYETALVLGQLALYLRPDFPVMRYTVGGILEALDRFDDAIEIYRAVGDDNPFSKSAKLRIAANLDRENRTDEAIELLRDLTDEWKDDFSAPLALGDAYRRVERWAEAISAYDEAVKRIGTLEPRHWQILYTRGIVLERAKEWERAEEDFLKALEFEKDQPLVLNYLGYSWVEQGVHLERALKMIETAVAKRPHDGYITDSLGWIYYKLGRYADAVPELERAVELRPEDPVINDHLGDAYWRVGRRLEATFQWNHALVLEPDPELKAVIEKKLKDGLVEEADAVIKTTPDGG